MFQLFDYAQALDIVVEYAPLRHRNGEYRHDLKRVRLRVNMPERLTRWTLAHELGHAVFEDVPSKHGPQNARQERRADEWAAMRLITLDAYQEAEMIREGHVPSMAYDLGVVDQAVYAYQRILARELQKAR